MQNNKILNENCSKCNKSISIEEYITNGGYCEECINLKEKVEKKGFRENFKEGKQKMITTTYETMRNTDDVILTTTNKILGYNIDEYIGIVAGTDIYLVGGVFGGGMVNQEQLYASALKKASSNLTKNAQTIGANAVIGIQSNLTSTGGTNSIIVTLTGTAVKISKY